MPKEQELTEDEFKYYTQKAGDISRQLGFAGIAIIWLFHAAVTGDKTVTQLAIPLEFFEPLKWLIWALSIDAGQYLFGSLLWGIAFSKHPTVAAYSNHLSNQIAIAASVLFIAVKLIVIVIAYWYLYLAVTSRVIWQAAGG